MFNARLETTKIKAGQPRTLGLLVEAAAPALQEQTLTRSPQAIVFVVDRSGSMGGGLLELIKSTISQMIGQLNPADYVSVISFDTQVETHVALRQKATLDAAELRLVPRHQRRDDQRLFAGPDRQLTARAQPTTTIPDTGLDSSASRASILLP